MKKSGIRTVVAIGIGTALFVILSYISVPFGIIPNTSLHPRTAVLAFLAAIYGPVAGGAIGLLGHTLSDIIHGGVWWSWVIPDAVYGLIIGLFASKFLIESGGFEKKQILLFNIVQIAANAIAWIGLAPILDVLIYAEPANKVFAQGFFAFLGNIITVAVLGTLLALAYTRMKSKSSSLSRED